MTQKSRCRICLADNANLQYLFHKYKGWSAYDKIVKILKINISAEIDPKFICSGCLSELDIAINFINKFQKAEVKLRNENARLQELEYLKKQLPSPINSENHADDIENFHGTNKSKSLKKIDTVYKDIPKRKKIDGCGVKKQKMCVTRQLACKDCGRQGNCEHRIILKFHSCDLCGKQFNKKDNLIIHMKRHSGERDWGCELCGARHYTAGELKAHCRTHTGERPFTCNSCPKRFTARANLRIHQRIHTGERPHKCDVCGKRFISKNTLNIHNRIHTGEKPYICPICGKRFSSNKLSTHARTHTGERPYTCSQCSRAFGSRRALTEHTRTHARPAARPHACPLNGCHQRYAHTQSLNKHIKKQHPHMVNNVIKPQAVAPT